MKKGLVLKKLSDKFIVEIENQTYLIPARKNLKKQGIYVGDYVNINMDEQIIEKVLPRTNKLTRPPMANLEQLIICISDQPIPDFSMLDKLLIFAEVNNIKPIICYTKTDRSTTNQTYLETVYGKHYAVISTSSKSNKNIDAVKKCLSGKISAFAGQSGVGKSALINAIFGDEKVKIGNLSAKIERGKNTTRHCELFKTEDFYIADTPGFSALDETYLPIPEADLARFYPDFLEHLPNCKFSSCVHINEKQCAVKNALESGKVDNDRYQRYIKIYNALKESRKY